MSAPISDWLRDATPRARPIAPAASPNAVTAGAHLSGRGRRGAVDLIKAARPEGLGPQAGQTGLGAQGAAWPLRNPAAACWPTTVCSGHGRTSPPDELRRKVSALCGASVPARTVTQGGRVILWEAIRANRYATRSRSLTAICGEPASTAKRTIGPAGAGYKVKVSPVDEDD